MTLINPLLGSNFSSKFDTTLIEDSVWLDGTADYFARTPAVAGNTSRWIVAFWVKRNEIASGLGNQLFTAGSATSNLTWLQFNDLDELDFSVYQSSVTARKRSRAKFRDTAWMHVCISFDSASTVSAPDRIKMFVNGNEIVDYAESVNTPSGETTAYNDAVEHEIGRYTYGDSEQADVYFAQFCMIEGKSFQSNNITINDILDSFEFGTNGSQFGPKSNADLTALTADAGSNSYALDFSDSAHLGHDSRPHNFIKHSEALGSWSNSQSTVVNNALVAPDGSQTMDTVEVVAGATYQWANRSQGFTVELSTLYTVSVHMKHSGSNRTLINYMNPSSPYTSLATLYHNWSGGTPTQHAFSGTGATGTPVLENVGNDIWRISFQVMSSSTATNAGLAIYPNAGFTGNDPVGVWGIQVEQGTLGTYVPTPKNILFHTQQFNNGYWQKLNGSTITADQAVAPDGTTTADLATAGNALYGSLFARRYLSTTLDVLPSTQYTLSCYVKKINYRYVQLRNPTSRSATFDFDTKTFLGVSTDVDATGYEDVGNGWFRIWSTATQPATGHNALVDIAFANSSGTSSFTPAGTETVYIWGAQFETGSAATSYREIAGSNAVNVVPNNFTPNSITAANQSTNTPSLVYPTMNPLSATDGADMTLSEGNLKVATTTNSRTLFATQGITEGAYYFEIEVVSYATGGGSALGIADGGFANDVYFTSASMITSAIGMTSYDGTYYDEGGATDTNNFTGTNVVSNGDILQFAIDLDNGKFWLGKNNTWADGTTPAIDGSGATSLSWKTGSGPWFPFISRGGSYNETYKFRFSLGDFSHTPPSGFVEINSENQPTPTLQGVDNFSVSLGTEEAIAPSENILPYSENPTLLFTTHNTNTITLNYAPAPDGIKTAALVADTSTSVGTFMQRNLTVPNDSSQYTWTFYVKKDDDTARFPVFWFNFFGNSLIYNYMNFDTKTGAIHNFTPTRLTARSVSEEDYWRVSMTIQNDSSGNNGISLRVDPAKVSALSNSVWTSSDVTMTGSLVFAHSQLMRNAPAVLPIDDSGSTLSGNMTGGGGLSAIFDGDKTKNNSQAASGANTNSNDSFVIVDHGSPKTVAAFTAYASTDAQGFDGDSGSSIITFTLAGSTDNFSSSNVALFSDTTGDGAGKVHAINSTSTSGSQRITLGAYRYHKMTVQTNTVNSGEKFGRLAQLEFFESTTPATYIPTYGSAASLPFTDTLDLIDTAPTENYIRNNTMEGASAGTPGTAPTGWAIIGNGATVQLVGYGVTDDGIEYVDYKFSGTPTFGDPWMYFQDGASIPALAGEEWTYSAYVALIAGSLTNLVSTQEIALQTIGRNSAGSYVSFAGQQQFTPASDLVRHAFTATLSGATVTRVSNKIIINWDGSGAIDATFRIGNPQMEKRSHASQVIKTGAHTMRQNLLTYSEQLDQWTASGTIAVANAMVAPDGSQTMDTLRVTTGSSNIWEHRQSIHGVVETSSVYTVSGYFKHDGTNRSIISFINPTSPYNNMAELGFAWSGGTPTQNSFSGTGTPVFTDVGNDIWRISFQVTTHATATDFRVNVFPNGGYLGTDVVGVWGMQVEIGSTANTYIPTTTAAVFEPTKRTSLNSFVEIQKNRDATETWAWRFSHDYDKEYAVSTTNTYQDIRDQTGTNNWVSYALKIAAASGTAAGAISHGFTTGNTVVTHGLTSSRYAVFLFPRNGGDIYVYHPDAATGELLILNSSAADAASTRIRDVTSTTFSIESAATTGVYDYLVLDDNGSSSALGKYTGNASSGGPYIATGHRPRLLIIKSLTTARDWVVFDTARDPDNVADARIDFSTAGAEFAAALDVDILADGFKPRSTDIDGNASGVSYAYISIGDIDGNGDLPPIYGR